MACRSPERTGAQTVAKTPEQREQARAAQVAHPAASTSAHDPPRLRPCVWSCELVRRRVWSSKANRKGTHAAASCAWVSITQVVTCLHPRVLCGSGEGHVFKIYLAMRLTRRMVRAGHLFTTRATAVILRLRPSYLTKVALRSMRRISMASHLFSPRAAPGVWRLRPSYLTMRLTRRLSMASHLFSPRAPAAILRLRPSYLTEAAMRLTRRMVRAGHLFTTRAPAAILRLPPSYLTEVALRSMRRLSMASHLFTTRVAPGVWAVNSPWKVYHLRRSVRAA